MDFADIGKNRRRISGRGVRFQFFTPADRQSSQEQRLPPTGRYYDLRTDRAVMTDLVLHTIDPMTQIPIVFRAEKVRQLAQGEFNAQHVDY